ncbi:MAG TPA: hypothetical protein DEB15_09010 [Pusillimonas sp.]|jgi:hypothetical protein|nr:hypothetical protein [Pusillimonas sp.]|tara:strand:+ start:34831 stop:35262 length:432 start_codon:yes stop_codon:yes gene_type:complete
MTKIKKMIGLSLTISLFGCASSADKIAPSYVSPLQYQNYDCEQLASEASRVHAAAVANGAQLNDAASNDAGITAAGAILFWPALFFLGGNEQKEAEYAKLRGEYEAIEKAAIQKKCDDRFEPEQPIIPVKEVTIPDEPQAVGG